MYYYQLARHKKQNTFSWCSQNLRLFDTSRFIWTDGLQVMFVLHRTGKFKPDLRFSLPVSVRKTIPFCVRSLGVVLLLVQAHVWVSGRPPPLWRLPLAAGSLRTGQTVTAVAFPPETGRIVPKHFIISHLLHCSGVPNLTHTHTQIL